VDLRLGDDLLPEETSRIVVADAAVAALSSAACVGKGYCLGTRDGEGPGSDFGKWDALFEGAGGVS
jgi:hypothetical protein